MIVTYDFHSHILPGIDDGAKDTDVSLTLIDELVRNGIKDICLTPHYYTHQESVEDFLSKRDKAFEKLKAAIPDDLDVRFHPGGEVFVTDYLFNQKFDRQICYDNTQFILTEFSYDTDFEGKSFQYIYKLFNKNMVPVIAHVERYPKLIKNAKKRRELLNMGVIFQSNFTSFTDPAYKRKLIKLVKDGEISLLGTDCHNMTRNSPQDIEEACRFIIKKCGEGVLHEIEENSKYILS